jgi:hypothetical protein
MRIRFEPPQHGWLPVSFEDEELTFSLSASDILSMDSLTAFAEAALSFVDWNEGRGRFFTEPTTYEFVLRRDGKTAIFELFELPDYDTFIEHGTLVFRAEDAPQALLLAFWRALRNLESRIDYAHWKYDFPAKAVERLGNIVKSK